MSKSTLIGLLGSVALRCIDGEVDEGAPPVPPTAYNELGNLQLGGIDDNDRPWHKAATGRGQEAWLLKQLYVERRFGRRGKKYGGRKKVERQWACGRRLPGGGGRGTRTGGTPIPLLMLAAAVLNVIPIVMIYLTRVLRPRVNRWGKKNRATCM